MDANYVVVIITTTNIYFITTSNIYFITTSKITDIYHLVDQYLCYKPVACTLASPPKKTMKPQEKLYIVISQVKYIN